MNEQQTEKLMNSLGVSVTKRLYNDSKGTNLLACCPFHGEKHPSFAVNVEKGVYNCFACGASGPIVKMISELKGISLGDAYDILEEFDNVDRKRTSVKDIRRYGESDDGWEKSGKADIPVLPMSKIAPFKSGKCIHEYLCKRGFSEHTVKTFKIGWNRLTNRITIPLFSRKGELWGWSERTVFDKADPEYYPLYGESDKYMIHEFPKSKVIFPLNLYEGNDTAILVEGILDAVWMHQLGYKNCLSIITANINSAQIIHLRSLGIRKLILFLDFDKYGTVGKEKIHKLMKHEFILYDVDNVVGKKDPQEMSKEEIEQVLATMHLYKLSKNVLRIS